MSIVKHCRLAELTEVSFEGFLLLFPRNHQPQPIGAWCEMLTHSHTSEEVTQTYSKHDANTEQTITGKLAVFVNLLDLDVKSVRATDNNQIGLNRINRIG